MVTQKTDTWRAIMNWVVPILLASLLSLGVWLVNKTYENKQYTDTCFFEAKEKMSTHSTQIELLGTKLQYIAESLDKIDSKLDRIQERRDVYNNNQTRTR